LQTQWKSSSYISINLDDQIDDLKKINECLWEIEDKIRLKENEQKFDAEFIALARSVYVTNDRRAEIKRLINSKTGSELVEEKSYRDYSSNNQ
jgi:prophage tail gpP-like protein